MRQKSVISDRATTENPMRDRILGAAFRAFMEEGYAGTSTLDIATRGKVSKRDLYANFGSKQEMLVACIESRAKRMRLRPDLPVPRTRQMLAATLNAFAAKLVREGSDPAVIATFRLAITEATRSPEIAQALDSAGRDATRAVALGRLRLCGVHSHLDCEPRGECRRRHVRHRVRLVDHQPGRQSDDRVPGSGRRQFAAVPVHSAGRLPGGCNRFAALADCSRTHDSRRLRDFCRPGFTEARNANALACDDLPARSGRSAQHFFAWLDARLADNEFICGPDFTIADIGGMVAVDLSARAKIQPPAHLGHLQRWYKDVSMRPSAQA